MPLVMAWIGIDHRDLCTVHQSDSVDADFGVSKTIVDAFNCRALEDPGSVAECDRMPLRVIDVLVGIPGEPHDDGPCALRFGLIKIYSGQAPPGNRMTGTSLPAGRAGPCGGRTTRQSEAASGRIIELSCTSKGTASSAPSAARTMRARR